MPMQLVKETAFKFDLLLVYAIFALVTAFTELSCLGHTPNDKQLCSS